MSVKMSQVEFPDDDEDDDMYSYFNKSISAVQEHADHFEQVYARPALRTSQAFFDEHPIAATFIAIFVFLSIVPVATFLGLSLFAVVSFSIVALTSTAILSATVVLLLLSLLVLTLLITFASSAFLTISGISIYSFASLLSLLRVHGNTGVSLWIDQMSELIFATSPVPPEPHPNDRDERSLPLDEHETQWSDNQDAADEHGPEVKREEPKTPSPSHEPSLKEDKDYGLVLTG
ncbi:hypothetical protein C0995_012380 [Termitomyces sp. Mi166|nr:hypothetical protein C0995_012380 [Termitomyces sp. Mi166\